MLYGGPQMGFDTPAVIHEVQLKGGNGFNVMGMAFAGVPPVLIGRNEDIAWTSTTATGDNVDTYVETLCGPTSYMFNGVCTPMEVRQETINVRATAPGVPIGLDATTYDIMRTVHGPVIGVDAAKGVAYSQKRAHWMREYEATMPFLMFDRAHSVSQFENAAKLIVTSHNFMYADQEGNIAYWQTGQVPLRPAGFDPRLPLPGTGEAEWPGGILPMPTSINPAQGWLANWNNKPAVWYDNPDNRLLGKQNRVADIQPVSPVRNSYRSPICSTSPRTSAVWRRWAANQATLSPTYCVLSMRYPQPIRSPHRREPSSKPGMET